MDAARKLGCSSSRLRAQLLFAPLTSPRSDRKDCDRIHIRKADPSSENHRGTCRARSSQSRCPLSPAQRLASRSRESELRRMVCPHAFERSEETRRRGNKRRQGPSHSALQQRRPRRCKARQQFQKAAWSPSLLTSAFLLDGRSHKTRLPC